MPQRQPTDWFFGDPKDGAITRIVTEKGFCFVKCDNGDYFLHSTDLENVEFSQLHIGDLIHFTPADTPKGLRATMASRTHEYSANRR